MPGEILLSTAYFPPVEYFSLVNYVDKILIEREENYIKQTYRNRCRILASNGVLVLSVPVMKGPLIKMPVKDVVIDYSKRWQQIHLRALISSYGTSPYFQYYFEDIQKIILRNHKYLFDLNSKLISLCLELLKTEKCITYTSFFEPLKNFENDFRYRITPKTITGYPVKPYIQVFNINGFVVGLSILDLLFNMGPDSINYL